MELGPLFELDHSLELEKDLNGTYDNAEADLHRQPGSPDVMRRQLSIDNLNRLNSAANMDDCFLERQPDNQRGSMLFFGLAMVFGAVGAVSTIGNSSMDASIMAESQPQFNSGGLMKSAGEGIRTADSNPIKDGTEIDDITAYEVDPSSAS